MLYDSTVYSLFTKQSHGEDDMKIFKTLFLIATVAMVSACQTSTVEQSGNPCDSVPAVTQTTIEGMEEEGAVSFVERNRSLMNLEIIWLKNNTPASCTRMYVSKIAKVENEDNGKIEIGYFRGTSEIWKFSPDRNYGSGRIENGVLTVAWSYGKFKVEESEDGVLGALWYGEPYSLVPGRVKGRVKVLEPLNY